MRGINLGWGRSVQSYAAYDDEDTFGFSLPCGGRVLGVGGKEEEGVYEPGDNAVLAEGYAGR